MEIRKITQENAGDLRLKNEPFAMPGRFIPALKDGVWTYRTETSPECQWMTFPDEEYDFETVNREGAAFGAYEDGVCIGEIVNVSADERILGSDGKPDASKLQPISFDGAANIYWALGEKAGDAFSDGKKLK